MKKEFVISIDLGGTKILSALINEKKEIVKRVKVPTDSNKGADFIVECILIAFIILITFLYLFLLYTQSSISIIIFCIFFHLY